MAFDSVFHGAPSSQNAPSSGIASLGIDVSNGQFYYRSPNSSGWQGSSVVAPIPNGLTWNDTSFGFPRNFVPIASGPFALKDSPIEYWDFSGFYAGDHQNDSLRVRNIQFQVDRTSIGGNKTSLGVTATANTTSATGVLQMTGIYSSGSVNSVGFTLDEFVAFEASFDQLDAGITNEYVSFRAHALNNDGGGTLGCHIALLGIGTNNFGAGTVLTKGAYLSNLYKYSIDCNPSVASCFGVAPICHSTQVSETSAPTVLDGWYTGTGSPAGVVVANIGSIYSRRDGSTNTTLYVKEGNSGTSAGWVAK